MLLIDPSYYEIQNTKNKGRGVFAKKTIHPGTVIGDYLGTIIPNEDESLYEKQVGLYIMKFDETRCIRPNEKEQNGAHILNHSCEENCAIVQYKNHNVLFALRSISPGEELTYHYSISPEDIGIITPYICRCDSPLCAGVMTNSAKEDELWIRFETDPALQNEKYVKEYADYSELEKLELYPDPEFIKEIIIKSGVYSIFGNSNTECTESQETSVPNHDTIIKSIMETGKNIYFTNLNLIVRGIKNNQLICSIYQKPITK